MNIKPKHLQFCMAYLQTSDPGVAYKMTYPKAGMKSLYAAASRLMARPEVSAWIEDTREMMQQRILREIQADQVQAKKEQLLSINEKRNVLTRIITGEAKRSRHIKTKYGVTKVEDDQPVYAILRAIDMDTRLENFQNYLIHRDSWGKTPVLHINPPTLQQQVNILIAQATKEEMPEGHKTIPILTKEGSMDVLPPAGEVHSGEVAPTQKNLSPAGGGVRRTGVDPLAQEKATQEKVPSPLERAEGEAEAPLLTKEGRMDVLSPAEEVHSGEVAPAPDKTTPEKSDIFFPGAVYLTELNKNATLSPGEGRGEAKKRIFAPHLQAARE